MCIWKSRRQIKEVLMKIHSNGMGGEASIIKREKCAESKKMSNVPRGRGWTIENPRVPTDRVEVAGGP